MLLEGIEDKNASHITLIMLISLGAPTASGREGAHFSTTPIIFND